MTNLAMPERWRFKTVDLSTYAVLVRKVDGVDELPDLRGENIVVPAITGRRWARKRMDQKRLTLAVWVTSADAAGGLTEPTNARQTRANLDSLHALFSGRTAGALVRVMPDGSERTASAEVVSVGNIEDDYAGQALGLTVDFLLADPVFYGAAVNPSQAIAASPTNFTLTNAGSAPTHRQVLTFTGPIANPRLINLTIDAGAAFYVEALVTVASAKLLVIDCSAFTATNDGVNAIGSLRHSGAFEFFRLEPGANSLRVTATSPGGSLAIAYSPSFI
jgi:hypothetical protein